MAKRPWYPRYVADYKMDTFGLSLAEHGAYCLLLDDYYYRGFLPSDPIHLYNICNSHVSEEQQAIDKVVEKFFERRGDRLHHKRVEAELENYSAIVEKRRKAIETRWKREREKDDTSEIQVNNKCIPEGDTHVLLTTTTTTTTNKPPPTPPLGGTARSDSNIASNSKPDDKEGSKKATQTKKAGVASELTEQAKSILDYLNRVTGRKFQPQDGTLKEIKARLAKGMTVENARLVIYDRWQEWRGDEVREGWANPKTIFRESNYWRDEGMLGDTQKKTG